MITAKMRGHDIYWDGKQWRYVDNDEPTIETHASRPCGLCQRFATLEGHDPCIAMLPAAIRMTKIQRGSDVGR